jgi:hypothetical protein
MSEANAHAENSKPGDASGKPPQGATKEPSAADAAHLFVFCNSKAGMGKVDKDKVNAIVMEMSKNSPYYKHELRQAEKVSASEARVSQSSSSHLESSSKSRLRRPYFSSLLTGGCVWHSILCLLPWVRPARRLTRCERRLRG